MSKKERAADNPRLTIPVRGLPLRARVVRWGFGLAWLRVVVQLPAFVTTVLVARILAAADYGVV
jgi:hypothetical protein